MIFTLTNENRGYYFDYWVEVSSADKERFKFLIDFKNLPLGDYDYTLRYGAVDIMKGKLKKG